MFFPWHHISISFGGLGSVSESYSALSTTNTFWAFLALLLTIAIVGVVIATRFTSAKIPDLPVPLNQAVFYASLAVLALLLIKLVSETDYLGFGAYLGILLAAGQAYGGFLKSKEPVESSGLA
jgi:predicted membrane channel-forming protein YqfA (hemolysin III family)